MYVFSSLIIIASVTAQNVSLKRIARARVAPTQDRHICITSEKYKTKLDNNRLYIVSPRILSSAASLASPPSFDECWSDKPITKSDNRADIPVRKRQQGKAKSKPSSNGSDTSPDPRKLQIPLSYGRMLDQRHIRCSSVKPTLLNIHAFPGLTER